MTLPASPLDALRAARATCAIAAALLCSACNDLDRFDTGDDSAYCGQIIDGRFVRAGFERQLSMELHLDTDSLQSLPGELTTFDAESGPCQPQALFSRARLRVPQATLADPLSVLSLGDEHDYTVMAWAESSCQGPMLAVVSLMRSGEVEVRLLAPPLASEPEGRFGVFHLSKQESCSF